MKSLSCLFFFLICLITQAQEIAEQSVPLVVRQINQKKYPAVSQRKWTKEGETYAVSQLSNKRKCLACYNKDGKLLSSETEVKISEVPKSMSDFIVANFRGKSPSYVCRITDDKSAMKYAADINMMRYIFDEKGNYLEQLILEE